VEVMRGREPIGWAVLMITRKPAHSHFGGMRFATVLDCLAVPGDESGVVSAVTAALKRQKVDLIVTNQLHHRWCRAFEAAGYLSGPSNFIFAVSPGLAKRLDPFPSNASEIHMTRGDGDGPTNI
jgi:hypothetical protein